MNTLLRCSGLSKAFSGVQALSDVSFDLDAGEVHALVGENGAGKSTLMHILAGVHQPDCGAIDLAGAGEVRITHEYEAQRLGIAIVYQERSLFDELTVAENLFVNHQPLTGFGLIDRKAMRTSAAKRLAEVELHVDPCTRLGRLSPAEQQMVEIAKALSFRPRILILDEPTAALTVAETETLFGIIRRLKAGGVGIIYISHRLEEIFEIADRVTVLKDGHKQGTWTMHETTPDQLVRTMVGREQLHNHIIRLVPDEPRTALEVPSAGLRANAGEIMGIAGLAGAGRTELALSIFGLTPLPRGSIRAGGHDVDIRSPRDAMAAGIGYLPEDRKLLGLFLDMTVAENIAAAHLDAFGGWRIVARRMLDTAREFSERLRIATPSVEQTVRKLSGGNQQKALLARWLLRDPKVLIVDEPTRGVDVGAKAEIYAILRKLADDGKCVIVISSELPEIRAVSDRILVAREGRIVAELPAGVSEEEILRHAAIPSKQVA